MTKKNYQDKNCDLDTLSKDINSWFSNQGYQVQSNKTEGAWVVQAQKTEAWRKAVGASRAFNIVIQGQPNDFSVEVGIGEWASNLTAGGVAALLTGGGTLLVSGLAASWSKKIESDIWNFIDQKTIFGERVKSEREITVLKAEEFVDEKLKQLKGAFQGFIDEVAYQAKKVEIQNQSNETKKSAELNEKLLKLKNALDTGILTQTEYETKKAEWIAQSSHAELDTKARLEQQALEREIREREQKERQASRWLESAINQATKGNFSKALETLKKIPNGTEAYFQAQSKISEYEQVIKNQILEQQRIEKEKEELIAKSKNLVALTHNGKRVAAALVDKTIHIVDSVTRKITISGVFGETTFADGEFVIINLVVRNEDKKSRNISASMITLIDSEGREFQTSSTAMTALTMSGEQKAELWSTQIQPGLDKDITIVFDIPPTAQDLKLKVPSGLFGQPAILPLSLAL